MHDHLQQSYGRDSNILEMLGVGFPWLGRRDALLLVRIVGVKCITMGINKLDIVIKL
jgi:hypothetical protein